MRVDVYSDFTLKDILQSYSSIQFSECIRDVGDIQLSFTDGDVYRNINVTEDILVVGNNAYLAENKHKTDSKDLRNTKSQAGTLRPFFRGGVSKALRYL